MPSIERDLAELVAGTKESAPDRRGPDIPERPTFVQWAGLRLVWTVFGSIACVLLSLVIYLTFATPDIHAFGAPVTADSQALQQKAAEAVFQRVTGLVDQIVIRVFLPVLTLLLGYVFGATSHQAQDRTRPLI
jgi:hypothetical protein